jgi:uncharacterized membrane protein
MKPLFVLLAAFVLSLLVTKFIFGNPAFLLSGRIAMSIMLVFTAIGHFVFTEGMALMIPGFIPYKKQVVYLTGIIEVAAAIGLLVPRLQNLTAILLIVFFVMILPANISAARRKVDY